MNAIILTFDRLPEAFLGGYGSPWIETPNFDRLAAQSAVFHQHLAEDLSVGASRHAWWTGRYEGRPSANEAPNALLPALLTEKGVQVRILLEGDASDPAFEGFPDLTETITGNVGLDVPQDDTPFSRLVARAVRDLRLLRTSRDEPWLLWIKSRGIPTPWLPPRELATRFLDLAEDEDETEDSPQVEDDPEEGELDETGTVESDAEDAHDVTVDDELDELEELGAAVQGDDSESADDGLVELSDAELDQLLESSAALPKDPQARRSMTSVAKALCRKVLGGYIALLDAGLGQLLDQIDRSAGSSPTLLIVTAAQGLVVREPGVLPDGWQPLAEETVHVPLMVAATGIPGGTRLQTLTQSVDLFPTLAEWFGLDVSQAGLEGQSLLPILQGRTTEQRRLAFLSAGTQLCGVRSQDFYLVSRRDTSGEAEHRLFAKPEDVWEVNDVAAQSPGIVEELSAELENFFGA